MNPGTPAGNARTLHCTMTKVLRLAFLLMEAAASGFLAPALLERMDRGFDRSLLAARWSAAFVEVVQGVKFQNGIDVIKMPAHHAA